MYDIKKFGKYLLNLRKDKGFTQSELADLLCVTRQAVSKWENGDSFPDISMLPSISKAYGLTLEQLINMETAPTYKIGNLDPLFEWFVKHGIDVGYINNLLNDLKNLNPDNTDLEDIDEIGDKMFVKIVPLLNQDILYEIFERVLEGQINQNLLPPLLPYMDHTLILLVEQAIIDGQIDHKIFGKN